METRNCQNCKKDFAIEEEDFSFYQKIKVPAPTFCPDCRRQRRLAWMNPLNLYKRDCGLCSESFISMYPPEAPYNVFCPKCWWSDKWDWRDYGVDYDFSKPFFEQFSDLLKKTPLCGLSINTTTTQNSPYNNHAQDLKNCYLTFQTSFNENSAYGFLVTGNKEVFDCSMVMNCESCYDSQNIFKSNRCVGSRGNARFSLECWFNRDCDNCTECIGCVNLRNKSYHIFNKPYGKEEYFEIKKSLDIGSWSRYQELKKKAGEFWITYSPKPAYDDQSVDYVGSYVFNSKNCKQCFDVTGAEDSKYLFMIYNQPTKDAYDISSWGGNLTLAYEGNVVGEQASNIRFAQESGIGSLDIEYVKLVFGSSHVFGGVSVRKGEYVILNKEYSKDEYLALREKIVEQMNSVPFVNSEGHTYRYGEFFPMSVAPFPYNKTMAHNMYPLEKAEAERKELVWQAEEGNTHTITKPWSELPDHIHDVADSIVDEVISCKKCSKGYRIIKMELDFLRQLNLPIPRECPFCRINEKVSVWIENMHLHDRVCDKCGIEFQTHYTTERAPVIFCKKCYQQEYY